MTTQGTTQEGDRLVLMTEALLIELVEAHEERTGKRIDIEWGGAITGTHTYYEPALYEHDAEDDEDEPHPG